MEKQQFLKIPEIDISIVPPHTSTPSSLLFSHWVSSLLVFILFLFNFGSEICCLELKNVILSLANSSPSNFPTPVNRAFRVVAISHAGFGAVFPLFESPEHGAGRAAAAPARVKP